MVRREKKQNVTMKDSGGGYKDSASQWEIERVG